MTGILAKKFQKGSRFCCCHSRLERANKQSMSGKQGPTAENQCSRACRRSKPNSPQSCKRLSARMPQNREANVRVRVMIPIKDNKSIPS